MLLARSARTHIPQPAAPQRDLLAALRAGELTLEFQPIVVLATGRIRGVEALLRWHLQDGVRLLPDDFLPAVAHTPVMLELTEWVIDRACAQAVEWEPWTMSVNIAAVDAVDAGLVDVVAAALQRHRLLVTALPARPAGHGGQDRSDVRQWCRAARRRRGHRPERGAAR